eukprot:11290177-Prorocentrum_lima.AAC.1
MRHPTYTEYLCKEERRVATTSASMNMLERRQCPRNRFSPTHVDRRVGYSIDGSLSRADGPRGCQDH